MDEEKQKEFQEKLTALLKEYSVNLQPVMNINIVPNPQVDPKTVTGTEEDKIGTSPKE